MLGPIAFIEEQQLDQSEKISEGYFPNGFENATAGKSTNTTIAGGDVRIFRVVLQSDSSRELVPLKVIQTLTNNSYILK